MVTFDGPNKLIILDAGITSITVQQIYSEWKEWSVVSDNLKYLPAFSSIGGEPTVSGQFLGSTYFIKNGWKIRPYEGNHTLVVSGNLFSDDGSSPFVKTLGNYNVLINLNTSNIIDKVNLAGTGEAPTADEIAAAVWDRLLSLHQIDGSAGKALSTASTGGVDVGVLAAAVWDEPLTGVTHNIPTSAGRRLRQISAPIILDGFVASSTVNTVTFDGGASTTSGAYDPANISIISGCGAGQTRLILEYDGLTKTATIDRNWKILPDNTSEFIIVSTEGREHVNEGRLQGGYCYYCYS